MILVFSLLIADYILTYIGIAQGIIVEWNPLMAPFFQWGFGIGILVRIVLSVILMLPFAYLKNNSNKHYRFTVGFSLLIYSLVFTLHIHWIFVTLFIS